MTSFKQNISLEVPRAPTKEERDRQIASAAFDMIV
jgi:hypothetical protein